MTTMLETSVSTTTPLLKQLRQELPELLREKPVVLAYLYGSQVQGRTTRFSDVDIALVLRPDHGLSAYERFLLELTISADLEKHCGIKDADVRSINDAPLRVQGEVLTHGQLIYSNDETFRVDFEVLTRKRYFDFEPVLQMMEEAYLERAERELENQGFYVRQTNRS